MWRVGPAECHGNDVVHGLEDADALRPVVDAAGAVKANGVPVSHSGGSEDMRIGAHPALVPKAVSVSSLSAEGR